MKLQEHLPHSKTLIMFSDEQMIPYEIVIDQFSQKQHSTMKALRAQVYSMSIRVTFSEELKLNNYRYYAR